jgi:hypothetical protein
MAASDTPPKKSWYEILIALTPLIVGVGVTGVGAYFTQVNSYHQLQANELAALDKLRPLLVSDDPFDREFAYASFVALGHEQLALRLMRLKQDSAGRAVAQRMQGDDASAMRAEAGAALQTIPAEVYLHIAAESQRAKATAVAETLRRSGYSVAPIALADARATTETRDNLLYFNAQDKAAAARIATLLGQHGMREVAVAEIAHSRARPGSLELWFATPSTGVAAPAGIAAKTDVSP